MATEHFDVNEVASRFRLRHEDIAITLFPHLKYPKKAYARVRSGEDELDVIQLERLAVLAKTTVSDLFVC